MTLREQQTAFARDVVKLLQFIFDSGLEITFGETWRTPEQELIYYKQGRTQTLNSNHLKRLAVDLNFFKDGKLTYDRKLLQPVGDYWESLDSHNSWGGNWHSFKDLPHFERRPE